MIKVHELQIDLQNSHLDNLFCSLICVDADRTVKNHIFPIHFAVRSALDAIHVQNESKVADRSVFFAVRSAKLRQKQIDL